MTARSVWTSEGDEGFEACDDGNSDSDDACLTTCELARCGDGIHRRDLNPNHPDFEECDDGNDSDDEQECSTTCISLGCGNAASTRAKNATTATSRTPARAAQRLHDRPLAVTGSPGVISSRARRTLRLATTATRSTRTRAPAAAPWRCAATGWCARQDLAEGAEGFEVCDDGNAVDEDACVGCQPARCGDGIVREDLNDGDDANEVDTTMATRWMTAVCSNACAQTIRPNLC